MEGEKEEGRGRDGWMAGLMVGWIDDGMEGWINEGDIGMNGWMKQGMGGSRKGWVGVWKGWMGVRKDAWMEGTGLFVWRVRSHEHMCKSICVCYLSHAWKIIFSWKRLILLSILVYECHLWIMRYMSIAYRRRWLRRPERCPKRKVSFIRLFCVGFQFRFFLRTAQAYTVYYFKC